MGRTDIHHRHRHGVRDRIVDAEVLKLELRKAHEREREAHEAAATRVRHPGRGPHDRS